MSTTVSKPDSEPDDRTRFRFGTKAETLSELRLRLTRARVCTSVYFTVAEWRRDPATVAECVREAFPEERVIVRSSALSEDSAGSTLAGAHDSVADVSPQQQHGLREAIDRVIGSYSRSGNGHNVLNQVLVQPMVTNISMSGVVLTHDLNTGAPYYVINYDDVSGKTDTVTSGAGDKSRTLLVHREHSEALRSARFKSLLDAVREVEEITATAGLDIEFAVSSDGAVYILQVRPLAVQSNWNRDVSRRVDDALTEIESFIRGRFRPYPGVLGDRSIFGEMPDWNPAEMIGTAPRKLALSLYRRLITDSIWAEGRAAMGYRNQAGRPLMVSLGGRVYIDVRESFNSFLPAQLPAAIGEKVVTGWLAKLERHPELHDKIEFEIASTVYAPDFDLRVAPDLIEAGLTSQEVASFADCLRTLTNGIITGERSMLQQQIDTSAALQHGYSTSGDDRSLTEDAFLLERARARLNEAVDAGTRPFTIAARCGFVAEEFLRALTRLEMVTEDEATCFRNSVRTVLSDFLDAVRDHGAGRVSRSDLLDRFGHLRPGTYDIVAQRYDQRTDWLDGMSGGSIPAPTTRETPPDFSLPAERWTRLDACLAERGYDFSSAELFKFMREAITAREQIKLAFSRNVSDAMEDLAMWGELNGLSREEVSHLSLDDIFGALSEAPLANKEGHFRSLSQQARSAYEVGLAIRLPFLILSPEDVHVVPLLKSRPNFITQQCVRAPIVHLVGHELRPSTLKGSIVLIRGADPGYDWIFLHDIAGLVTQFGGANSHMAIRCAELRVPAAIGCGEQLFERLAASSEASLDCAAGLIVPVE